MSKILTTTEVEVVTDSQVNTAAIAALATAIEQTIDLVAGHEGAFEEATLEYRLEIGLYIAQAQEIFTMSNHDRASLGGVAKAALSTVDKADSLSTVDRLPIPAHGFVSWLNTHVKRLKRPTAYRYAQAFRALELPTTAKPAEIRATLKTLRHQAGRDNLPQPTLKALAKQAPKPEKPTEMLVVIPTTSKQLRLEDARECLQRWMDAWDDFVKRGRLDDLDKRGLEQLKDFQLGVRDRINARLK